MEKPFKRDFFGNVARRRWYGLRQGDIVRYTPFNMNKNKRFVVVRLLSDNNACILKEEGVSDSESFEAVAEWCRIIEKAPITEDDMRTLIYEGYTNALSDIALALDDGLTNFINNELADSEDDFDIAMRRFLVRLNEQVPNLDDLKDKYYG